MKHARHVIRKGNELFIPIPGELCREKGIREGDAVNIYINKKGNIEAEISFKSRRERALEKCMLCGKGIAKYTCINCGNIACSNCFWELGSLCYKCARTAKGSKKQ